MVGRGALIPRRTEAVEYLCSMESDESGSGSRVGTEEEIVDLMSGKDLPMMESKTDLDVTLLKRGVELKEVYPP